MQEKDSLASELHVRHIAIEQLLKNYSKLPCLQVGRTGVKSHLPINNWTQLAPTAQALPRTDCSALPSMQALKKLKKVMVHFFMVIKFVKLKGSINIFVKYSGSLHSSRVNHFGLLWESFPVITKWPSLITTCDYLNILLQRDFIKRGLM